MLQVRSRLNLIVTITLNCHAVSIITAVSSRVFYFNLTPYCIISLLAPSEKNKQLFKKSPHILLHKRCCTSFALALCHTKSYTEWVLPSMFLQLPYGLSHKHQFYVYTWPHYEHYSVPVDFIFVICSNKL